MSALRIDIGCGDHPSPGFEAVDIKAGQYAYPLAYVDNSVDELRASHVLEHFAHTETMAVLRDWVRVLKPGGLARIAVPDFYRIAQAYLQGADLPIQGYVMGGLVDEHDRHGAIFDAESLTEAMLSAGLVGIAHWQSELTDCASLPISLNLAGTKPPTEWPKVHAVMSVPRLGWNDFWGCALSAFGQLGIKVTKHTGAYWDQCLTRAMDEALLENPDWVLAVDYDSVFTGSDVQSLLIAAMHHPDADAIAAVQVHRQKPTPLMTIDNDDGVNIDRLPIEALQSELVRVRTAHFGLTLIRADKLRTLTRPWFCAEPADDGEWSDDRVDADISFWRNWRAHGHSLYVANRVPIGHIDVMVRWPNEQMSAMWQHPNDYHAHGKPAGVWR